MINLSASCVAVTQHENYLNFIRAIVMEKFTFLYFYYSKRFPNSLMNIQISVGIFFSYKLPRTKASNYSSQFGIMQKLTILGENFEKMK